MITVMKNTRPKYSSAIAAPRARIRQRRLRHAIFGDGSKPERDHSAYHYNWTERGIPEQTAKGRILALDLGKKRIGLAVSDPLGITAQGLPTLQRTNIREDLAALARLIGEHEVRLILMGHPLHMSGREGRQAEYTREFAERLAQRTGLEIRFWDERLTTVAAKRVLRESGISIEKRARAVDRLAAVILLESYLDFGGPSLKRAAWLVALARRAGGRDRLFSD